MQFKQLKNLRMFIFLLLTVFLTDTVYASGMMVANQLASRHQSNADDHCTEPAPSIAHSDHHNHDTNQEKSTNDHCSKCGHCMACFTLLPPSQIDSMQSQLESIAVSLFESSYLSHISAQPHRPPISK